MSLLADRVSSSLPPERFAWLHAPCAPTFIPTPSNFEAWVREVPRSCEWDVAIVPRDRPSNYALNRLVQILTLTTSALGRPTRLLVIGRSSHLAAARVESRTDATIGSTGPVPSHEFVHAIGSARTLLQAFEPVTTRSGVAACAMSLGVPVVGWLDDNSASGLREPSLGFLNGPATDALAESVVQGAHAEIAAAQQAYYRRELSWTTAARRLAELLESLLPGEREVDD
jgi:glycosyltransferase involved in cell wall biosynthesis